LIQFPRIMFRRKKTPTRIQEVLINGKYAEERGIIANLPYADVMGTSGQGGSLRVDYATLKKIFGKPSVDNKNGRGCKIRKEWIISIDGVVCTIYDWKQGYDYTKPKGGMPLKHTNWSVGGSHRISFRLVQGVIDSYVATGILPNVVRLKGNNEGW
jgi:hypothetical protein